MKKFIGAFLIILSVAALVVTNLPQVNQLKTYPSEALKQEKKDLQIEIDALKILDKATDQGELSRLKTEVAYYKIELARREYQIDFFSVLLLLIGAGLIAFDFLGKTSGVVEERKRFRAKEALPAEIYVEENEYLQRREDGFSSKEKALEWYETDPLRSCPYCGSGEMAPTGGIHDEIQLITFYKKVPEGAKDLRIIWGALWFVNAAPELQCGNCAHKVLR